MRTGSVVYHGTIASLREQAPEPAHRLRTSDDTGALALAAGRDGLAVAEHDGGLAVRGTQARVDAYVVALVQRGIVPRSLTLEEAPLESLFFMLTESTPETLPDSLGRDDDLTGARP